MRRLRWFARLLLNHNLSDYCEPKERTIEKRISCFSCFEIFPDLRWEVIFKTEYDLCCVIPEVRVQHSLIAKFSIDLKESFVGERTVEFSSQGFLFFFNKEKSWLANTVHSAEIPVHRLQSKCSV